MAKYNLDLYGGKDPRLLPAYSFREAALCVRVPVPTLRVWALGRSYVTLGGEHKAAPMFDLADRSQRLLSFVNLVEAHVLRGLRTEQAFTMRHVRTALRELVKHEPPKHPLAFEDFLTDGIDLFVDRFGALINLNQAGQIAMRETLVAHLRRIDRSGPDGPIRFFPFIRTEDVTGSRAVSVSPTVAFGRPVIAGTRITTAELVGRINAGDSLQNVAEDLNLTPEQVTDAILFEKPAQAA